MSRLPVLSEIEADGYEADGAAVHISARWEDNRDPATRQSALGSPNCWCGEPFGHSWPGKAAGAPHPRDTRR